MIEPFDHARLGTSSYDVRLGEWFYREQHPDLGGDVFDIFDPSHVEKVWGQPQRAPFSNVASVDVRKTPPISTDRVQTILLDPGETILAHTEEFIGGRVDITSHMRARSSLGRCFITVCKCAGWGDVGYINRWTMEITNVSRCYKIPLRVGSRVAQIIFDECGEIRAGDYASNGAYQTSADIEQLRANWQPSDMLPKVRP